MTKRSDKTKSPPTPEQAEAWREEVAALRAEIAELKKHHGDADAITGLAERLSAIEKKLAEKPAAPEPAKVALPGGSDVELPPPAPGPASPQPARPAAKEKKPKGWDPFDL